MKHGGYGYDPNSHKREYEASYRARIKFVEQALKDKPWQESYTDNSMENMYCECLLEELDYDDDEIFIEEFIDECISSFEAYSENVEISW
jgi:predicted SAM-dependent methyltransferase